MHQRINSRLIETPGITLEYRFHFKQRKGRKKLYMGKAAHDKLPSQPTLHIPHITKLLALAHYYQKLIDEDGVKDYAEIARLTGTSRARITQIMNLTLLAPEIQEKILDLHEVKSIKTERRIRMIAGIKLWKEQLELWEN